MFFYYDGSNGIITMDIKGEIGGLYYTIENGEKNYILKI